MMGATQYNEKMTVIRDMGAEGDDGIWAAAWVNHLTDIPCRVQIMSGRDVVIRERITSRISAVFITAIRDITTKDRIVYDSELYNIGSVTKLAGRFMRITAERNTEEDIPDGC
jgi:head-tail adaptor